MSNSERTLEKELTQPLRLPLSSPGFQEVGWPARGQMRGNACLANMNHPYGKRGAGALRFEGEHSGILCTFLTAMRWSWLIIRLFFKA